MTPNIFNNIFLSLLNRGFTKQLLIPSTQRAPNIIPKNIIEVNNITRGNKRKFKITNIKIDFLPDGVTIDLWLYKIEYLLRRPAHPKGLKGR
jgi:hypothetical protein